MKRRLLLLALALGLAMLVWADLAAARDQTPIGAIARRRAAMTPWHGNYYHAAWGQPVALVVPPNAGMHTDWQWGVSGTRISTIRHQFAPGYPGPSVPARGFLPTPVWPSDTSQFGVYYIRAPW